MPHCGHCDTEVATGALVRHEHPRMTVVHCPSCAAVMGQYRRHGDAPETDHLRP